MSISLLDTDFLIARAPLYVRGRASLRLCHSSKRRSSVRLSTNTFRDLVIHGSSEGSSLKIILSLIFYVCLGNVSDLKPTLLLLDPRSRALGLGRKYSVTGASPMLMPTISYDIQGLHFVPNLGIEKAPSEAAYHSH